MFESVDEILRCDHSYWTSLSVPSHGVFCFSKYYPMKFGNLVEFWLCIGYSWEKKGSGRKVVIPMSRLTLPSAKLFKPTTRLTSHTNVFTNAKSHARKKLLLAGWLNTNKKWKQSEKFLVLKETFFNCMIRSGIISVCVGIRNNQCKIILIKRDKHFSKDSPSWPKSVTKYRHCT